VGLSNGIRKYTAAIFLVMFFASATLAAANNLSLQSDTIAQTIPPTNKTPIKTSTDISSPCFAGYPTNFGSALTVLERKDMPVGSLNECFNETAAIALHKDGDKIIWSLAPSFDRFSLNPIDDIKKLHVLLQYKFWF
jgi:hypothetical protein